MKAPIVTIAIRAHEGCNLKWLDQAVASVKAQTCRDFWPVLAIDGSIEYSQTMNQRYELPSIETAQHPDVSRRSIPYRVAVAGCGTEYFKPLDYDDQIDHDYLARALSYMDANEEIDLWCCRMKVLLPDGSLYSYLWPNEPIESTPARNQIPHLSVLLRTSAVIDAGNYVEHSDTIGDDDWGLWVRMINNGARMHRDDQYDGAIYRRSSGQITELTGVQDELIVPLDSGIKA